MENTNAPIGKYQEPLTIDERRKIESCLKDNISYEKMADIVGRSRWTIRNEVKLKGGRDNYTAEQAQIISDQNLLKKYKMGKNEPNLTYEQRKTIHIGLKQFLTYGQIAQILNRKPGTIKNEVGKRGGRSNYDADEAEKEYQDGIKHRSEFNKTIPSDEQVLIIKEGLAQNWSKKKICYLTKLHFQTLKKWLDENIELVRDLNLNKTTLEDKINALQLQIDIIFEKLKEKSND
jgi:IS30 family transposase